MDGEASCRSTDGALATGSCQNGAVRGAVSDVQAGIEPQEHAEAHVDLLFAEEPQRCGPVGLEHSDEPDTRGWRSHEARGGWRGHEEQGSRSWYWQDGWHARDDWNRMAYLRKFRVSGDHVERVWGPGRRSLDSVKRLCRCDVWLQVDAEGCEVEVGGSSNESSDWARQLILALAAGSIRGEDLEHMDRNDDAAWIALDQRTRATPEASEPRRDFPVNARRASSPADHNLSLLSGTV